MSKICYILCKGRKYFTNIKRKAGVNANNMLILQVFCGSAIANNMKRSLSILLMMSVAALTTSARNGNTAQDTIPPLTVEVDTLREVEVRPDSGLAIGKAIDESLKRNEQPRTKSLGDVLESLLPGLQDKILHPFAFKDRKKERKHKRDRQILRDFDRTKSSNDLLEEALRREGLGYIIDQRDAMKAKSEK